MFSPLPISWLVKKLGCWPAIFTKQAQHTWQAILMARFIPTLVCIQPSTGAGSLHSGETFIPVHLGANTGIAKWEAIPNLLTFLNFGKNS
jgi:hypothetical protein